MSRLPRRIGWLCMALALAIALAARGGMVSHYGPVPAVVVVMLVGGVGIMLVLTDAMVRGLYAQLPKGDAHPDGPAQSEPASR
jgi:hypothetical protein